MTKPTMQLEYSSPNARTKARIRNVTPTELDRLYHDGLIDRSLHDAGEAAMGDLWKARMLGPAAVDYNTAGGGGDPQPMSKGKSDALKRVNVWVEYVDADVGMRARRMLMAVLCDNQPVETSMAIIMVRQALHATMKHHDGRRKENPIASLGAQAFRVE